MDDTPFDLAHDERLDADVAGEESALVEEASTEYLGRWNRLISTTNWEKGRIISEWRQTLVGSDAPSSSYSDEAWSRRVGNVTPQHVGRLRRVYGRFGSAYEQYDGLYWSHFQAALDWDDAEMWLQGAVENAWSVAQMRGQRWEALGAPPEKKPREEDIIVGELDEDLDPACDEALPETISDAPGVVQDAEADLEEELPSSPHEADRAVDADHAETPAEDAPVDPIRPFEDLPTLPPDLNEAFELFKLAIVQHRLSGWQEISLDDVLAVLNALKALAMAPADD